MKILIVIVLFFSSLSAMGQDIRDSLTGCYYCNVDKYSHGSFVSSYSADTVRIEKNDTTNNLINIYLFWPTSIQYRQLWLSSAITGTTFAGSCEGTVKYMDSLYMVASGSSYLQMKYKCKYISPIVTFNKIFINSDIILDFNIENKQLILNSPQQKQTVFRVYNTSGVELRQQNLFLQQGINTISLDGLSPGMYVVLLNVKEKQYVQKIVVY